MDNLVSVNKEKLRQVLLDIDRLEYNRQQGNDLHIEKYTRMLENDVKELAEDESIKNIDWNNWGLTTHVSPFILESNQKTLAKENR